MYIHTCMCITSCSTAAAHFALTPRMDVNKTLCVCANMHSHFWVDFFWCSLICTCIYVDTYVHVCLCVFIYVKIYTHIHKCVFTYVHIYTQIYTFLPTCVNIHRVWQLPPLLQARKRRSLSLPPSLRPFPCPPWVPLPVVLRQPPTCQLPSTAAWRHRCVSTQPTLYRNSPYSIRIALYSIRKAPHSSQTALHSIKTAPCPTKIAVYTSKTALCSSKYPYVLGKQPCILHMHTCTRTPTCTQVTYAPLHLLTNSHLLARTHTGGGGRSGWCAYRWGWRH